MYEQTTGNFVEEAGFLQSFDNEDIGCSPDGLMSDRGLEIKCPYNASKHIENLTMQTQAEFKRLRKEYYAQVQLSMYVTGMSKWDFVSYHPDMPKPAKLKILEIERDDAYIEKLVRASEKAIELIKERVEIIKNN